MVNRPTTRKRPPPQPQPVITRAFYFRSFLFKLTLLRSGQKNAAERLPCNGSNDGTQYAATAGTLDASTTGVRFGDAREQCAP